MTTYCDTAPGHPFHGPYHDTEYGFPTADESVLFERLVLEINQAGLSWLTVLKKRAAFFCMALIAGVVERLPNKVQCGCFPVRAVTTAAIHFSFEQRMGKRL